MSRAVFAIFEVQSHARTNAGEKLTSLLPRRLTKAGKTRVVVECTVPEVAGALHIYSPEQLVAERNVHNERVP